MFNGCADYVDGLEVAGLLSQESLVRSGSLARLQGMVTVGEETANSDVCACGRYIAFFGLSVFLAPLYLLVCGRVIR
jgi:hypothetical protein